MIRLVAVTGATGNIGRALAARLLDGGIRVRAIARNADRLRRLTAAGAEMLHHSRAIIEQFREAGEAMQQLKGISGGRLNVTVISAGDSATGPFRPDQPAAAGRGTWSDGIVGRTRPALTAIRNASTRSRGQCGQLPAQS